LADRCAHRSAPLSIGQIRDDLLECKYATAVSSDTRYHGWKYAADGKVAVIPALLPDRDVPANARVHRYPLVERYGLIWIWPGSPEDANPLTIPQIEPGLDASHTWAPVYSIAVDLDIDHSLMIENLLDPAYVDQDAADDSHLPFTHEGTLAKRKDAKPLEMETTIIDIASWAAHADIVDEPMYALRGQLHKMKERIETNTFYFIPPCHVALRADFAKPGWKCTHGFYVCVTIVAQTMHCVPTRPGHMRLIYSQSRTFFTWFERIPGVNFMSTLYAKKIMFQDYELLHGTPY
jgi:phenylpropionate dioxygenase-like ring-hydroxylating dioxygenase large terminal subunit